MTKPTDRSFKTTRRSFVASTAATAAIAPFFIRTARAGDPEITLKLASVAPKGTPWSAHVKRIKDRVKETAGDRIKIRTYLGGALGDEISTLDSAKRNRVQMWAGTSGALASKVPELAALELPYLFPSLSSADKAIDANYDAIDKLLANSGFKLLFMSENGHRSIGSKGGFIHSPKDLVGKKMRAQQGFVHENTWKALGASPVPIPVTDVLPSLQNGVVEGFDNTPLFTFAASWYQAIDHFTLTRHSYQPGFVIMSMDAWKALAPADQTLLLGDPNEEAKWGRKKVRAIKDALIANFGAADVKVHESTEAELAAFKKATAPVHKKFTGKYGSTLFDALKKSM